MKRWHDEYALTIRQWHRHRRGHVEYNMGKSQGFDPGQRPPGSDPRKVDCPCDAQAGRFRKRDAHDCGRARCQVCHGYKVPKRQPTRKERLAVLAFREQLRDQESILPTSAAADSGD
jgi:hypothetical protein